MFSLVKAIMPLIVGERGQINPNQYNMC